MGVKGDTYIHTKLETCKKNYVKCDGSYVFLKVFYPFPGCQIKYVSRNDG